ncbi:MAG TPA: hypothetical protein VMV50_02690 [Candidatus Paceibacterota bacterium]|nr:hypothetical protein [Candidatus Paceibacterota bacterium]
MESGSRVRTVGRVWSESGFVPIGTEGVVICAAGENAFRCEFPDVSLPHLAEPVTITATAFGIDLNFL